MALEGTYLGRYHIVRLLGSGGMGEVYLAEDPRIGQQVALKVVRTEMVAYPGAPTADEAARLFLREAQAIVALDHPAILPLHEYGEVQVGESRLTFLVMPYRKEGSLAAWVRRQAPDGRLPPPVVAHLVSQAAEALQHAHEHGVIHQDIKPANFLLRARTPTAALPEVLLADFGIARLTAATANTSQAIRGTPTYMAPEQCLGQPVIASDQYALAIMAYELLAGRPPFLGSPMQIMFQHVNAQPEAPSIHRPTLSSSIDEVLLIALAKRPEDRFRSVTAFAVAFQEAVQTPEAEDAETITTPGPAPKLTATLPDLPLISPSLARAPTYISPPGPAPTTPVSESLAEEMPIPVAQGWAGANTGPTALPLPETVDLGKPPERGLGIPVATPGWTAEKEAPTAPTAPPLEETRSLWSWEAGVTHNAAGAGPVEPAVALATSPAGRQPAFGRQSWSKRRFILIAAAALVMLALVGSGLAYLLPETTATVTITPKSRVLSNTYTISAVMGTPDSTQRQVKARLLSVTTPAQTKAASATGQKTVSATQAHGTLYIENFSYNTVTLAAGTTFPNLQSRQITMVLDATVTLPPATCCPESLPSTQAPGHVLQAGSIGDFPPFTGSGPSFEYEREDASCSQGINGWCYLVDNHTSTFSGGQDAYNGPVVQQSDIDGTAQELETTYQPQPQQVLQPQLQPNEQVINTPPCTPTVSADHAAGDEAAQVTVSVSFTCTGEAFDADAAAAMAASLLTQQAAADPGAGYVQMGKTKSSITDAATDAQNMVTLHVSATGTWVYALSTEEMHALAQLIAGKSVQEAQRLLVTQTGVARAFIKLSGGLRQRLPSDPAKITVVMRAALGG